MVLKPTIITSSIQNDTRGLGVVIHWTGLVNVCVHAHSNGAPVFMLGVSDYALECVHATQISGDYKWNSVDVAI